MATLNMLNVTPRVTFYINEVDNTQIDIGWRL
jgi:hypothetical protein